MTKPGPWRPRQIAVTAVFLLSVVYGVDALLTGDSSSKPKTPEDVTYAAMQRGMKVSKAPGSAVVAAVEHRSEPTPGALLEAQRWSQREWERTNPFEGESWLLGMDEDTEVRAPAQGDTVLRATSFSPAGWRAVVGERVLEKGDEYLGGRVVEISDGKVVIRGSGWSKTLQFPQEKGY